MISKQKIIDIFANYDIKYWITGKNVTNGWNHVQEKFHFKTLVKNMDELYRGLLEKQD